MRREGEEGGGRGESEEGEGRGERKVRERRGKERTYANISDHVTQRHSLLVECAKATKYPILRSHSPVDCSLHGSDLQPGILKLLMGLDQVGGVL